MEGRMKKCRQLSPERTRVRTEPSPKHQQQQQQTLQVRKVPVVYYLCRNRHLEHPHFIEVPLPSPQGLYLRDVIDRLNVLRGKGMAAMYSWSCKRSYKNGFVWHDLCEDDLILPSHGNEYVLKGSEILDETNSDRVHISGSTKSQTLKQMQEPISSRSPEGSSSSSSIAGKESKSPQEENTSPSRHLTSSSGIPLESIARKSPPWGGSLSLMEFKVHKASGAVDASTQTEDRGKRGQTQETCTRGVSTDDELFGLECIGNHPRNLNSKSKENSEFGIDDVSPPPSSSSTSSGGKTETLESLIRAEACKVNSFRILEEEEVCAPMNTKVKASNILMQLISCGSFTVKDHHSFGLIPTYKPTFSQVKFHSPFLSSSVMLGELDCLAENPRLLGIRLEDKEYFSGSLIETKKHEEAGYTVLKRSSSYNADSCKSSELTSHRDTDPVHVKCIPRTIKASSNKHSRPRNETMKSPISDGPRNSSAGADCSQSKAHGTSKDGSKRVTDPSSGKRPSKRLDSFKEEEMVVKIEERLSSGARVIIQSTSSCDAGEGGSNTQKSPQW